MKIGRRVQGRGSVTLVLSMGCGAYRALRAVTVRRNHGAELLPSRGRTGRLVLPLSHVSGPPQLMYRKVVAAVPVKPFKCSTHYLLLGTQNILQYVYSIPVIYVHLNAFIFHLI